MEVSYSAREILSKKHCAGEDLQTALLRAAEGSADDSLSADIPPLFAPDCGGLQKDYTDTVFSSYDCTGHGPAWVPLQCDCDGPDCGGSPWDGASLAELIVQAAHADCAVDCHCHCDCTEIVFA